MNWTIVFDFQNACAMLMDYNLSHWLTNFFLILFACTLESLLNQSKGDGMSNCWLVKLFIIIAKCCPIAHFHVIVICLWLQFLVDCCNFIYCNGCNEMFASNFLLLLLLLWWFFLILRTKWRTLHQQNGLFLHTKLSCYSKNDKKLCEWVHTKATHSC
jgi:hypothetical protein